MWRAGAQLSSEEVVALVNDQLPPADQISRRTLSRYESDDLPSEGAKPLVLAAIARACGRRVSELPESVLEGIAKLEAVVRSKYWTGSVQRAA